MADFLRFYHIRIDPFSDDYENLTGPQFFALSNRLTAYDGVMSRRAEILTEEMNSKEAINNPRAARDSNGKRVKTSSATDWFKQRHSNQKQSSELERLVQLSGGEIQR